MRAWLDRPVTQEALWLASPDLLASLGPWRDNPESAKGQKLERALYRYFARMTCRATPFGLFAACTVGTIGGETRMELASRDQCRRRTWLDMELLYSLAESIALNPALRTHAAFRPNDSIHLAAGKYHHLSHEERAGQMVYRLIVTDPSPAFDATLQRAAKGATADALISALLSDDPDVTPEEAEHFLAALVESQVLVPALLPPITGAGPVPYMIAQMEDANLPALADTLRAIENELSDLDAAGLGADLERYRHVANLGRGLPASFRPGRLVQVDVFRPAQRATLNPDLVDQIYEAILALQSIQTSHYATGLQAFKEEFALRYQDQEVPLLMALDDEAGIGFEGEDNSVVEPLLAGVDFQPVRQGSPTEAAAVNTPLSRRLEELAARGETVLRLDAQLVRELATGQPAPLPDCFAAIGTCFRRRGGEQGFYLQNVLGPSGINMLARFCHADQHLAERVQNHVRAEEELNHGDTLYAEILHLPEGRVGNVVRRPILRDYEIPFLATPGVAPDHCFPLSDLTVSLVGDRIVLRSRRLGRAVEPRLSSAHDFTSPHSLKIYKFLGLLQHQGILHELSWDWGALSRRSFLPRVVLGKIVLSAARWTVEEGFARDVQVGTAEERMRRVQDWLQDQGVPRFGAIAEGDNHLHLDFENPLCVEIFLDQIAKNPQAVLVEMWPPPDELPVRGPEGAFVHEIVLPFVRRPLAAAAQTSPAKPTVCASVSSPDRGSVPVSDWLFAKLYCSPTHADLVLRELVKPLVCEALESGAADKWFFVRYADPRWHLRLRFHGAPADLNSRVRPRLCHLAGEQQRQGRLWRVDFDTYEPEIERYGGLLGIQVAEDFFHLDSDFCLELLGLTMGSESSDLRWQLAVCAVDGLLSGLGLGLQEMHRLVAEIGEFHRHDLGLDRTYKQQVTRKFRTQKEVLTELLRQVRAGAVIRKAGSDLPDEVVPPMALAAFAHRAARLRLIRDRLEDLRRANELDVALPDLAASFAHMHLNRMLRSRHQQQEAVACEFLKRVYATSLAWRS